MPEFKISSARQALIDELVASLPFFRKSMHISQSNLAEAIGKSRQTISDIERKSAPMGWDTYLAVIKVFECNGLFAREVNFNYADRLNKELTLGSKKL